MRKPPPGMNNMPKNAGETKAQYMERVRATKPGASKPRGMSSADPGSRPRGMSPIPPKPPTPTKPTVTTPRPISPKGGAGAGGGRGTAPRPGYGGGKPRRMMSGGMVKGKK